MKTFNDMLPALLCGLMLAMLAAPVQAATPYLIKQSAPDQTGRRKGEFAGMFRVPNGLEARVEFWKKVYGVYKTSQTVIHDSKDLRMIYEVLDFSSLEKRRLSQRERDRIRYRAIKRSKKKIHKLLHNLARGKLAFHQLSEREWGIYRRFQQHQVSHLIGEYAKRGRIRSQDGLKEEFLDGMLRSGRFLPMMEAVFLEHNLPWPLTRIAFVESLFHQQAHSKVGASGIWQFMPATGKQYMRIDGVVDERLDPILSTAAAAKLLNENYDALQSWPLAITAYNHGRAGMQRAKRRLGTSDIVQITEGYASRSFGFASQNFYSEFLAALQVEQNAADFFGAVVRQPPMMFDTVEVSDYVALKDLAQFCSIELEQVRDYNPSLTTAVIKGEKLVPRGFRLRLPRGSASQFVARYAELPETLRKDKQKPTSYYRVRRGDSLYRIARRFDLKATTLARYNHMGLRERIYPGQRLRVPAAAARRASRKTRLALRRAAPTHASGKPQVRVLPLEAGFAERYMASIKPNSVEPAIASLSADAAPAGPAQVTPQLEAPVLKNPQESARAARRYALLAATLFRHAERQQRLAAQYLQEKRESVAEQEGLSQLAQVLAAAEKERVDSHPSRLAKIEQAAEEDFAHLKNRVFAGPAGTLDPVEALSNAMLEEQAEQDGKMIAQNLLAVVPEEVPVAEVLVDENDEALNVVAASAAERDQPPLPKDLAAATEARQGWLSRLYFAVAEQRMSYIDPFAKALASSLLEKNLEVMLDHAFNVGTLADPAAASLETPALFSELEARDMFLCPTIPAGEMN